MTDRNSPHRRPLVHVNCATSADGRLAYADGRRARLSGPEDLARVHALRADSQAILVGIQTVLLDDPSLRVKWEIAGRPPGPEPIRVVLDSRGRTPRTAKIFAPGPLTLLATAAGVHVAVTPPAETFAAGSDRVDLDRLLGELDRRGVHQLLVEGGGTVIASFLRAGLVDRLTVYVAPVIIGGATAPPMVAGPETVGAAEAISLRLSGSERLGDGLLLTWEPRAPGL